MPVKEGEIPEKNAIRIRLCVGDLAELAIDAVVTAANQSLPAITRQVLLDGWSQGGAGYQGPPLIVLNGTNAGFFTFGLTLKPGSDGSTVRGLVVQQFFSDAVQTRGLDGQSHLCDRQVVAAGAVATAEVVKGDDCSAIAAVSPLS